MREKLQVSTEKLHDKRGLVVCDYITTVAFFQRLKVRSNLTLPGDNSLGQWCIRLIFKMTTAGHSPQYVLK